jgi:hypothetical protein
MPDQSVGVKVFLSLECEEKIVLLGRVSFFAYNSNSSCISDLSHEKTSKANKKSWPVPGPAPEAAGGG